MDFGIAHSSASLAFGYWDASRQQAVCKVDRAAGSKEGGSVLHFGARIVLKPQKA